MLSNLFVLALMATGLTAAVGPMNYPTKVGDMDMMMKQKKIFELFMYIGNDLLDAEYFAVGQHYDIVANIDRYTNKVVVIFSCKLFL